MSYHLIYVVQILFVIITILIMIFLGLFCSRWVRECEQNDEQSGVREIRQIEAEGGREERKRRS